MRNTITALVVLGLLSAGLEGVRDSVDIVHDGDSAEMHEKHHSLPEGPASPDHTDPDGHSHYCHCGLHLPPLFAAATVTLARLQHANPVTVVELHALDLGPPPLPPPIA